MAAFCVHSVPKVSANALQENNPGYKAENNPAFANKIPFQTMGKLCLPRNCKEPQNTRVHPYIHSHLAAEHKTQH